MNAGLPAIGGERPVRNFDSAQTPKNWRHASSPADLVEYPNGQQSSFAASSHRALMALFLAAFRTLTLGLFGISWWYRSTNVPAGHCLTSSADGEVVIGESGIRESGIRESGDLGEGST